MTEKIKIGSTKDRWSDREKIDRLITIQAILRKPSIGKEFCDVEDAYNNGIKGASGRWTNTELLTKWKQLGKDHPTGHSGYSQEQLDVKKINELRDKELVYGIRLGSTELNMLKEIVTRRKTKIPGLEEISSLLSGSNNGGNDVNDLDEDEAKGDDDDDVDDNVETKIVEESGKKRVNWVHWEVNALFDAAYQEPRTRPSLWGNAKMEIFKSHRQAYARKSLKQRHSNNVTQKKCNTNKCRERNRQDSCSNDR